MEYLNLLPLLTDFGYGEEMDINRQMPKKGFRRDDDGPHTRPLFPLLVLICILPSVTQGFTPPSVASGLDE